MLPLVGIAALMVAGFVVFMAALTYDEPLARERRRRRKRMSTRAHELVVRRSEVRKLAVTLSTRTVMLARRWWPHLRHGAGAVRDAAVAEVTWAVALAQHWWPRFRYQALAARRRWLTFQTTTGEVVIGVGSSLIVAYLLVAYV